MKFLVCCFLFIGIAVTAEERVKRQASYTFPGPRSDRSYRPSLSAAPVYVEERDEAEVYPASRRQYQPQSQPQPQPQPQYVAAQPRAPIQPVAAPAPAYEAAPRQPAPAPRSQSSSRRRESSAASNRANKYGSAPQQNLNGHDEEEEEDTGPDRLTLLLEDSQFTCGGKQDGYYADDSVNCQVFHYCVSGAKHSWMCPENTVFHQVHLNCVPDAQDICSQSQKFHFVNDYLYKPVDYEGPNNTARYSQRYYPDGYVVGDPLVAPQEARRPAPQSPPQYHSAPPSQPRPQARPEAPAQQPQTYRAPQPQPAPQPRPQSRPSRPLESYPVEEPREYRPQVSSQAAAQAYRGGQPQPQQPQGPPVQAYRVVAPQQGRPSSHSTYSSSEEAIYQPQPSPQSRRPAAPAPQRQAAAAYAPPRQQYRQQTARSGAGYQPYASNQAAGVEYDEDY